MLRFAPILVAALFAGALALGRPSAPASSSAPAISDIAAFLDQCPPSDPAYAQIRSDFEIRREGVPVGVIPCSEPVSAMSISQYTDELIAVQALRTVYYMEGGRQAAYPWTAGSLYDWLKSKVGGFDLSAGGSNCCASYNGRWYPRIATQNDWDRDYDRKWEGISNQITLMVHEARHVDGYPHVGYCPLFPDQPYGCDPAYDEQSLSPYGAEWWLNAKWLSGEINVGFACGSAQRVSQIAAFHQSVDNQDFRLRFVASPPPVLSIPPQPGGACPSASQPPTPSPTIAPTPSPAATPTVTPGPTVTPTPTSSPTATSTPAPSPTATPTPTAAPTSTPSPTATSTPAPSPTATPTPSGGPPPAPTSTPPLPSPTPFLPVQANANCDGATDSGDLLLLLRAIGGAPYHQPDGCGAPGHRVGGIVIGDVDCSGAFDGADVLALLRYLGGLGIAGCGPA